MPEKYLTPGATGIRRSVERFSATPLVFLHQLPRWGVPLALVVLLITGLAVTGWIGAAALVVVAVFLGWLGYLSWPSLSQTGRLLRVIAVLSLLLVAVGQVRIGQ